MFSFLSLIALGQNITQSPTIKTGGGFVEPGYLPALAYPLSEKEEIDNKIKAFALKFFNEHKKTISVEGKKFPTDCSSFVRAVYYAALKKDVFQEAEEEEVSVPGNNSGVETIYRLFEARYEIKKLPDVGDVIFFHNSYDKNRNRKWDDLFTHAAVVVNVDDDQTITFIHGGTRRGVAKDYMNLKYPHLHKKDGKIVNSYLQRTYKWMKTGPKLTAELFYAFGAVAEKEN